MFFFLLSPPPGIAWFSRSQVLRWTKTPKRSTRDDSFRRQKKKSGLGRRVFKFGCRPPQEKTCVGQQWPGPDLTHAWSLAPQ